MLNRTRAAIAAIAAMFAAAGLGGATLAASAASSVPAAIPPVCRAGNLVVWVSADGGNAGAGTQFFPLEFTNVSRHTCRVWGYPGVSATSAAGRQLGDAASRNRIHPPAWVDIPAGGTAHALLGYGAAEVNTSNCKPATASFLKVYPPDQTSGRIAFFGLPACTLAKHGYLLIGEIQPGASL